MSETAKCNSCLEHVTCKESIKDQEICSKYHTRVVELFDGKHVSFHCSVNNKFSREYIREDLDAATVAGELHVRVKDIWLLLVHDIVPQRSQPTNCPQFDVSEPLDSHQKQHIRFTIAHWLMENYHFLTLKSLKGKDKIYVYEQGVYTEKAEELIVETIRIALGEQCSAYDRNETRAIIRDLTIKGVDVFNHEENIVCLQNGILNVDTLEFGEHSPTKYFWSKIPVNYNPKATCPKIEKFFSEIVNETDVQTLVEAIAYCLYPGYPLHKAFMFVGFGGNGKTVFLKLAKTMLGEENCSALTLQQLDNSRFATSALIGKFANICADIPAKGLGKTGTFKALTGNDLIGGEFKFGKHHVFKNCAKLLFSANQVPKTIDDTPAFFRRWIVIVFPNVFSAFSEPKADPHLLGKLTTAEELSGLLNKAVPALRQLLQRGKFHGDKPTAEWREDYIRKSDPVGAFFMDCLEEINDRDIFISKAELYEAFVKYCKANKLPSVDNSVFSRKIKAHFELAHESRKGSRGAREKGWSCLKFKEEEIDETVLIAVKGWCQTHRNERNEIKLEELTQFIKEELKQDNPREVIAKAYDTILMSSKKLGVAVVV